MRTKLWPLAAALVLALAFVSIPVAADPPVMDYLTGTIRPILDTIRTSVTEMQGLLRGAPRLQIVKAKFTTMPSSLTVFNLDLHALPALRTGDVSRYTVSLVALGGFSAVPAGTDLVELAVSATDGTVGVEMTVASTDPSTNPTIVQGPYTGTDSIIRVRRGKDGLGPVDVYVSAYIEHEPTPLF